MSEDKDKKGIEVKLGPEDSALIVRTDGSVELFSRELSQDNKEDNNYLGDLEDLNKTFTLVLAFAAALENEQLYTHLYQNLNHILHRQWDRLPNDEKQKIDQIRLKHLLDKDKERAQSPDETKARREWLKRWKEESEKGRQLFEDYMAGKYGEVDPNFDPEDLRRQMQEGMEPPLDGPFGPRKKRKKQNPLVALKDVKWNPYDDTLKANRVDGRHSPFKGNYKLDDPPDEED